MANEGLEDCYNLLNSSSSGLHQYLFFIQMASDLTVSGKLTGKIVNIDADGNLISDLPTTMLGGAPRDATLRIVVDEHETFGLFPKNHEQPAMTLVAVADEGGPITIVLVNDSASAMLGIRVGAPVEVHW